MNQADFLRVIGVDEGEDYTPVAGILSGGYGFAGYFNSQINKPLDESFVLINVRLMSLEGSEDSARPGISDFNQFVEEIVLKNYLPEQEPEAPRTDFYGKSIPLAAIPFDQVVAVYPVAQMGKMMQDLQREGRKLPSFLDFTDKSIVLKLLRTKLW